jgi:hypothetical protein
MYVDAQTYQPLETVNQLDGFPDIAVGQWLPATPDNIAQAQAVPSTAGLTKVARAY